MFSRQFPFGLFYQRGTLRESFYTKVESDNTTRIIIDNFAFIFNCRISFLKKIAIQN